MEYKDFESKFKTYLHYFLKQSTGVFLDFMDAVMKNPDLTVAQLELLGEIKNRGKKQFMECQNGILAGAKCILETGEAPQGIDKRATKLQSDSD